MRSEERGQSVSTKWRTHACTRVRVCMHVCECVCVCMRMRVQVDWWRDIPTRARTHLSFEARSVHDAEWSG